MLSNRSVINCVRFHLLYQNIKCVHKVQQLNKYINLFIVKIEILGKKCLFGKQIMS
jgi:hypothetical protein